MIMLLLLALARSSGLQEPRVDEARIFAKRKSNDKSRSCGRFWRRLASCSN